MFTSDWFKTSQGEMLAAIEKQKCQQLIPTNYYNCGLQLGLPWIDYLENTEVSNRFFSSAKQQDFDVVATLDKQEADNDYVMALDNALPFPEKSCDVVVLPHTLDFCSKPHGVLRQINQILSSEGCLVLIGFNKFSLYSLTKMMNVFFDKPSTYSKFYRLGRVQDWLSLLGIDIIGASMIEYGFPVSFEKTRQQFSFLEKSGDRWWPTLGGIYIIVGQKRQATITPVRKKSTSWHKLFPAISQSTHQKIDKS